jgi:hypothetical protein
MALRLWPPVHAAYDLLRYVGLRDRLRCPHCGKIGTFKPHGGRADRRAGDTRGVRRWLCKWCGYYLGPEGVQQAFPSAEHGAWALVDWGFTHEATPEEAVEQFYGRSVDPWRG